MSAHYATHGMAIVLLAIALPTAARAAQSGTATLAANASLNLDTGAVSSTGDILWNGIALTPLGRAGLYNAGKYSSRAFKSIPARYAAAAPYNAAPIPAGALVVEDVFGVHTNGGHYAKVMVTAVNGTSLALEYTTFFVAAAAAAANSAPIITQLQNNYSFLLPAVPNYGIAPGSLFIISGTGLSTSALSALQSSSAPGGLPTSLNQTSISVTVGGITTTPALYYTSATQLGAVLPSTTPVGTGTITVTYNGQTSAVAPIKVAASALGLDTLYGTGAGSGVITNNSTGLTFGLTSSAMPGQVAVLWGSGVGADTNNDDRTFPLNQNNLTNIPMQVFVGGVPADILYRGRSQYPGVDQIDITIPPSVSAGCFVSVVAVSGSIVSNSVTLPVSANGGSCSEPALGLNGNQLQTLAAKVNTPANTGAVFVTQTTSPTGTVSSGAAALFSTVNGAGFGAGYAYASQGSCIVLEPPRSALDSLFGANLDPGTIQLTGPAGARNLTAADGYSAQLPVGALTSSPGTYTFNGSGGMNVGKFNVAVNVQTPFTLTNKGALASIIRSQGATVTWSGGFPDGEVIVTGATPSSAGFVYFYCYGAVSTGQLTIPSSVLMALPAGVSKLNIINGTAPQTVSASGLDFGGAAGSVAFQVNSTLN